ncbi:MAG TPA: hypothetical protein VD788_05015 [Candidatus Polarisedimenticolaceae bacterium]|nr:hypothetical protein [Candidatus Polarisedimenticolaceae bacterium]
MWSQLLRRLALAGLLAALPGAASAGSIHLAWDAVPGATGYRAYFGTASGQYTGVVDMKNATSGTLTGLLDCTTYYVSIKAYDTNGGISSQFSNEVAGWARPLIDRMTPTSVVQGETRLTVDVFGANFDPDAALAWSIDGVPRDIDGNELIVLEDLAVQSCTELRAYVTLEPAARGLRAMQIGGFNVDFEVVNPDTVFGTGRETIQVELDEIRADINQSDGDTFERVDGKDLTWLARAHASREGQPYFNPDADLDGDGMVDGSDLAMLAARFGRCWSGASWSDAACN